MCLLLYRKAPEVSLRGDHQLVVTRLVQLSFVARGIKPKPVIRRRGWLLTVLILPRLLLVETSKTILSRPNTAHLAIGIYSRCDSSDALRRQGQRNETTTVAWQCAHTHVQRASTDILGRVKPCAFLWTSSESRQCLMWSSRHCTVMGCTCAHHVAQLEDVDRFVGFRPSTVDNSRVARAT